MNHRAMIIDGLKVAQRAMIDKTERHFDINLDELKGIKSGIGLEDVKEEINEQKEQDRNDIQYIRQIIKKINR